MIIQIFKLTISSVLFLLILNVTVLGESSSDYQVLETRPSDAINSLSTELSLTNSNNYQESLISDVLKQNCGGSNSSTLGRLYYLANPYEVMSNPEKVREFVRANASNLTEHSEVIQCARILGNFLINQGIQSFGDRISSRERMYDLGDRLDVPPLVTQRAVDEMYDGTADLFFIGQELIWLSEVIPYASVNNWVPFFNTGTEIRREFYQIWPLIVNLLQGDYMLQEFDQLMKQIVQPYVEEQIMILANMI